MLHILAPNSQISPNQHPFFQVCCKQADPRSASILDSWVVAGAMAVEQEAGAMKRPAGLLRI